MLFLLRCHFSYHTCNLTVFLCHFSSLTTAMDASVEELKQRVFLQRVSKVPKRVGIFGANHRNELSHHQIWYRLTGNSLAVRFIHDLEISEVVQDLFYVVFSQRFLDEEQKRVKPTDHELLVSRYSVVQHLFRRVLGLEKSKTLVEINMVLSCRTGYSHFTNAQLLFAARRRKLQSVAIFDKKYCNSLDLTEQGM